MRKFWQKIDENINRIVYWVAFLGLVSIPMSWVAAYITPLYQYGWGAVVFAGVGAACAIMLVISSALVAWRYFNPVATQLAPTEDKTPTDFIKNILICTSSPDAPASFGGTATTNLERVNLFLDYSAYFTGLGFAGWSQRRRIELASFEPFEKDILYEASVVSRTVGTDGKIVALKWGNDLGNKDIIGKEKYRARLAFVASGKEQYFYFMLAPTFMPDGRREVIILNQNDFCFQNEWEKS
jgi:hypothetical protein